MIQVTPVGIIPVDAVKAGTKPQIAIIILTYIIDKLITEDITTKMLKRTLLIVKYVYAILRPDPECSVPVPVHGIYIVTG